MLAHGLAEEARPWLCEVYEEAEADSELSLQAGLELARMTLNNDSEATERMFADILLQSRERGFRPSRCARLPGWPS